MILIVLLQKLKGLLAFHGFTFCMDSIMSFFSFFSVFPGFVRVRALCRILRLSNAMESEVVSLFESAYNLPNFLHVTLTKKEILGGCCLLCVCRQRNWPVSMGTVGYLLGADNSAMGTVYQELTKSLNIQATTSGITDLMESFCYEYV